MTPTNRTIGLLGGAASFAVTIPAGCRWTSTTDSPWLGISAGAEGAGNGTVSVVAGPNLLGTRTATLTIAGRTVTVTQTGLLGGESPR